MKLFLKHSNLCEKQTYRQTDGRMTYCGTTALCIALHGKKQLQCSIIKWLVNNNKNNIHDMQKQPEFMPPRCPKFAKRFNRPQTARILFLRKTFGPFNTQASPKRCASSSMQYNISQSIQLMEKIILCIAPIKINNADSIQNNWSSVNAVRFNDTTTWLIKIKTRCTLPSNK